MSKSAKDNAAARGITAHLQMPEASLAVFVVHSNGIFPDFPHNERSKNERALLLHFAFFLLHFAFDQQVKRQREVAA